MPFEPKTLAAGAEAWIGTPAHPLPEPVVSRLREVVGQIRGVVEAHLPLVYIAGAFDPAAQVLVLVLSRGVELDEIRPQIEDGLKSALPAELYLDIWPMRSDDASLGAVRATGCALKGGLGAPKKRRWWQWLQAR